MHPHSFDWLTRYLPQPNTAGRAEQLRAGAGALLGLALTAALSYAALGAAGAAWLVAPMGASAVLVFGVPASPLAQPWSVIGGNTISALIGVACVHWIDSPMLAAPLAGALAILAMFTLRCLHPPGGAAALTVVLAGPAVHAMGIQFAFAPVALNSALLVLAGLLYNNLTGRRYPHLQQSSLQNPHATADLAPTARVGFTPEDLDAVLARYGQVLDISRDDLESIILQTEMQAYVRRFGVISCADIMSRDVVTLSFASELQEAWGLMRRHRLHALPVLNSARRVIGIVTLGDFLRHGDLDEYRSFGERMRRLIRRTPSTHSDKPEVVGQIMCGKVQTARDDMPIVALVPLMANSGVHHIPVVDAQQRFVGMVTQSDLVAALYESRLGAPSALPEAARFVR
ncbi:MAG: HPP family protein [Pseudomonadota bacterium]